MATPHLASAQWSTGSAGAIYYNGGYVGIGTTNPSNQFAVTGTVDPLVLINQTSNGAWNHPLGVLNGNVTSGQNVLMEVGHDRSTANLGYIGFNYSGNGSSSNYLTLGLWAVDHILNITAAGNVGIGTTSPQHLLHVAGTIGAEEVLVTSTGADYVFERGYRLRPLAEVAKYIEANHHLPDIPSADEVKQKGMGVGVMEAKLLAKIEELTLHLIQQDNDNRELRENLSRENRELRDRIARLEAHAAVPATAR